MNHTCCHYCCQFEEFLFDQELDEILYFEDMENYDSYCIFHAPEKIKNNFRNSQKVVFNQLINEYIVQLKENYKHRPLIDFTNVVFLDYGFKNKNLEGLEVDLTNATFINNVRFDNLKCKKLILKDTKFLDGGAIKNRDEDANLTIEELEFRPYALHSDFVIDIGRYVNDEGLVELDKQGTIQKLRFENHKVGAGKIFFIGLNDRLIEANFRNMVLDNVFFQNCDLRKCYFLNSKIDKTEFRNCYFPQNDNKGWNEVVKRYERIAQFCLFVFSTVGICFFTDLFNFFVDSDTTYSMFFILSILLFFLFLTLLNFITELALFSIKKLIPKKIMDIIEKSHLLNPIKQLHTHYCIADEKLIYEQMGKLPIYRGETFYHQRTVLQKSLDSLSSSYSQLKDNFKEKDFQVSGDFFYSQRYTEVLSSYKRGFLDLLIYEIHHVTNGFGESYLKPFFWFMAILVGFASLNLIQPNIDYISTSSTPYFLVKKTTKSDDNKTTILQFNQTNELNSSFFKAFDVNKTQQETNETLLGYDGRYNFEKPEQYILALDENKIGLGLIKSFSNMIYPFTPEQKRWFQNISEHAVFLSLLESIFLWYFAIAFILALWHRIKR